jgi:hypothetical protein
MTHTATPWAVEDNGNEYWPDINAKDADGDSVTIATVGRANAEFIVRACNAHDDLVKALQELVASADMIVCRETQATLEDCDKTLIADARAALAKAGAA